MAISTNSIIHYTKNLDSLLGILENGFALKYCREHFWGKKANIPNAYPMICFCDIPMTEAKNHLEAYGHFGIGLKKEWAIKKGLNPVLYLEKESFLTDSLMEQAKRIYQMSKKPGKSRLAIKRYQTERDEFIKLCSFIKNYEGDIVINGETISNYRFYDEREWRFVPNEKQLKGNMSFISSENYLKDKESYNEKIKNIKLDFIIPGDISYVIVKEEEDIHRTLDFITQKFKKKLLASDIEILMTKILTTYQIIKDF